MCEPISQSSWSATMTFDGKDKMYSLSPWFCKTLVPFRRSFTNDNNVRVRLHWFRLDSILWFFELVGVHIRYTMQWISPGSGWNCGHKRKRCATDAAAEQKIIIDAFLTDESLEPALAFLKRGFPASDLRCIIHTHVRDLQHPVWLMKPDFSPP
jgi:hypothetical protein